METERLSSLSNLYISLNFLFFLSFSLLSSQYTTFLGSFAKILTNPWGTNSKKKTACEEALQVVSAWLKVREVWFDFVWHFLWKQCIVAIFMTLDSQGSIQNRLPPVAYTKVSQPFSRETIAHWQTPFFWEDKREMLHLIGVREVKRKMMRF